MDFTTSTKGDDKDNNIEDASWDIIFWVDSDIDIDSHALRDMISPDPVIIQPVFALLFDGE